MHATAAALIGVTIAFSFKYCHPPPPKKKEKKIQVGERRWTLWVWWGGGTGRDDKSGAGERMGLVGSKDVVGENRERGMGCMEGKGRREGRNRHRSNLTSYKHRWRRHVDIWWLWPLTFRCDTSCQFGIQSVIVLEIEAGRHATDRQTENCVQSVTTGFTEGGPQQWRSMIMKKDEIDGTMSR